MPTRVASTPVAEVFVAALKSLPKKDLQAFYTSIAKEKKLIADLLEYLEEQEDTKAIQEMKKKPLKLQKWKVNRNPLL